MSPELALRLPHRDPYSWFCGALAASVHLVLAVILFFGVHWQTQPPETVAVELYSGPPPAALPAPTSPPPREEVKPDPPAPAKADIAIKNPEKPKAAPVKTNPPAQPTWTNELQAASQAVSRDSAAHQAAKALDDLKTNQANSARGKAEQEWIARVRGKIRGNVVLPANVSGNPECVFSIELLPDGSVLNVGFAKRSGNEALDAAVERAIRKSSPLPLPTDKSINIREFRIAYRPLDN